MGKARMMWTVHSVTVALALLYVDTATPAPAAGAWADQIVAPTLRQRGWRYATQPLAPGSSTPLTGGRITRVSWSYHYESWPRGLRVMLCVRDTCVDASTERGWSDAFAGLPAASRFRFHFEIAGRGMLARAVPGQQLQLIVNFR